MKHIPNILSVLRGLLAVPMALFLLDNNTTGAFLIAILAFITDILDGFLARRLGCQTETGKIFDPIADKIFAGTTVIILLITGRLLWWFAAAVIARDVIILISGLFVSIKAGKVPASNIAGKSAMVLIGLTILLAISGINDFYMLISMSVSVAVMFLSLIIYAIKFFKAYYTEP